MRLDRWFKRHYPAVSHGRLEKLLRTGQIRIDGARAKSNDRLKPGQIIRVPPIEPDTARPEKQAAPISDRDARFVRSLVLRTEPGFLVLNKPAGLAVQGGSKTTRHLDALLPALAGRGEERPRLVHRLDRDTSGAIVIARSAASAAELAALFRTKAVTKIYWALVHGVPSPRAGTIDVALAKQGGRGNERMEPQEDDSEEGQRAITHFEVVSNVAHQFAWVALMPVTGRTHQLRAHLAAIGHPIVGDPKYGKPEDFGGEIPSGLQLHARRISLPGGKRRKISVEAPLPPHMAETWRLFGFEEGEANQALAGF
ncbi:MAG: RluA family pseudouridine synthase [Alphaproteobacteria bacterium]